MSFPLLERVGEHIWIRDNTGLAHLDLSALANLGYATSPSGAELIVERNPKLPECEVWGLDARLRGQGGFDGTTTIAGNDEGALCP